MAHSPNWHRDDLVCLLQPLQSRQYSFSFIVFFFKDIVETHGYVQWCQWACAPAFEHGRAATVVFVQNYLKLQLLCCHAWKQVHTPIGTTVLLYSMTTHSISTWMAQQCCLTHLCLILLHVIVRVCVDWWVPNACSLDSWCYTVVLTRLPSPRFRYLSAVPYPFLPHSEHQTCFFSSVYIRRLVTLSFTWFWEPSSPALTLCRLGSSPFHLVELTKQRNMLPSGQASVGKSLLQWTSPLWQYLHVGVQTTSTGSWHLSNRTRWSSLVRWVRWSHCLRRGSSLLLTPLAQLVWKWQAILKRWLLWQRL